MVLTELKAQGPKCAQAMITWLQEDNNKVVTEMEEEEDLNLYEEAGDAIVILMI